MRSVWFFNRLVILVLGAALLGAPLLQTRVGSQSLSNHERDRSRVALEHSFQAQATASDHGVLIEWRTGFEPDNLGFNVFRVANGQRTQLNRGLIAGSAVLIGQSQPGSYAWFDAGGKLDSAYSIEAVDVRGQSTVHDAFKPVWSARLPERAQSELLEYPGASERAASKQTEWPETSLGSPLQTSLQSIGTETLQDQWTIIANQPALKIGVRADGWYRITQTEMAAAGFATSADAHNLRLFVGGNEIAMRTSRDSGALTTSDYVEFWGQGLDLATTDTQIYWLVNGAQAGKRIAIAGEVNINAVPATPGTSPPPIAGQDPPVFWFGGVGKAEGSAETEGRRQEADGSEQKTVSSAQLAVSSRGGNPTVREDAEAEGSKQKTVSSAQLAVSSRGGNPTVREDAEAEGSRQKAESSKQKAGGRAPATIANSKLETQNSKLSPNSKLKTRNSKLRSHRRHSRSRRRNHPTITLAAAPNFIYNVQRKDRISNSVIFFPAALNGDQENFFGEFLSESNTPSLTLTLRNVETTSAATAQVTVALQGVSVQSHQVNVLVNGLLAGTIDFIFQDAATQTFSFPVSWLVEGDNLVKLVPISCLPTCPPGHDSSLLDYVRISYPHSFRPDNDSLQFSVKSTLAARIDGFTSANIRVLDISDPANVQLVHPIIESSGPGFALTIQPVGRTKGRRLIALPDTQLSHPVSLALNTPSTLNLATNGADLVIISHKDFIPALAPLVAQRQSQFSVRVADVEDVFDEFSYGVHTPQAIRDFLARASTNWATPPHYVLLVGDASYDPRNYTGFGNFDFVPTKLVDTGFRNDQTALETASDDWLTDFDNNGIADISIGRLPMRTLAEANMVVAKIVNYSPANPPQSALLVADAQGTYYFDFEAADDQIATLLPLSLGKQKVYRRLAASDAAAHQNIINNFNSGQVLVVYSGHGNTNIWGGSIFSSDDAMALTNGNKLPFVVVMDCLNGFFTVPQASGQSLAEALVKAPNGGAVASFASSGLTIPDGQHQMGFVMFQLLYGGATIPIGDASRQAKSATADIDVRRTWILFGDPTMKIR
jgi:Peptidase family C25